MKLSLRERRRRKTALDIQRATLELAVSQGLDNTRVEAIAERAGVSPRTFFNYYPNKESAAVGMPLGFCDREKAALREGKGDLVSDLEAFFRNHVRALAESKDTLRMVRKVVGENEKARIVLERFLRAEREDLLGCIRARVGDPLVAMAIADNALACTSRAIDLWERDGDVTLEQAFGKTWKAQVAASRVLAAGEE